MKRKFIAGLLAAVNLFSVNLVYAENSETVIFKCDFERLSNEGFEITDSNNFQIVSNESYSGMFSLKTQNEVFTVPVEMMAGEKYIMSLKWKAENNAELYFKIDDNIVNSTEIEEGDWKITTAVYEAENSGIMKISTELSENSKYYIDDFSVAYAVEDSIEIEGSTRAARGKNENYKVYLNYLSGEKVLIDDYAATVSDKCVSEFSGGMLTVSENEKLGNITLNIEYEGVSASKEIEIFDEIERKVFYEDESCKVSVRNITEEEKTVSIAAGEFLGDVLSKVVKFEKITLSAAEERIIDLGEEKELKVFVWQEMKPAAISESINYADNLSEIYVATNGSDENDGTFKRPLKTLEAARDKIRDMEIPEGGITVFIRGGTYFRDSAFTLGKEDSGTKDKPIAYMAYPGEKPVFTQGISLDLAKSEKVTDSDILAKLPDDNAKEHLYSINLKEFGINELSEQDFLGGYISSINTWVEKLEGTDSAANFEKAPTTPANELFFEDSPMTAARFPNNDEWIWLNNTDDLIDAGATPRYWEDNMVGQANYVEPDERDINDCFTIRYTDRVDRWINAEEALLMGFWYNNWAAQSVGIGSIDTENNTVTSDRPSYFGVRAGYTNFAKYYVYNLIEELDTDGEYYFDRDNLKLYFYRSENMTDDKALQISSGNYPFLSIYNASYITIDGLEFTIGRSTGINISANDITVKNCTVKNLSSKAISVTGENNLIYGCTISDVDGGVSVSSNGTYINGFKYANSRVEKCKITDFSRRSLVYTPAVTLNGVGNAAINNEISGSYHMAVSLGGMDNLLTGNEIYDVCRFTDDASAIYMGRSWTKYGNRIVGNYIHDLTPDPDWVGSQGINAIYADDLFGGLTVSGNIFENIDGYAVKLHGGYDHVIENNIFIDCDKTGTLEGGSVNVGRYAADADEDYILAVNCVDHLNGLVSSGYLNSCWTENEHAVSEIKEVGGNTNVNVSPIENFVLFMKSDEWKENEEENIKKYINSAWHEKYPQIYRYISQNAGETYNNIYRNNVLINSDDPKETNMTDERFLKAGNAHYKSDVLISGEYRTVDYSKLSAPEQTYIQVSSENMGIDGVNNNEESAGENPTGLVIDDTCETTEGFSEYSDEYSTISTGVEDGISFVRLEGTKAVVNNNNHAGMVYNTGNIFFKNDEVITLDTKIRYKVTSADGSSVPYMLIKANMPESVAEVYKCRIWSQKAEPTGDGSLPKYPEVDEDENIIFSERAYGNQSYDATLVGFLNGSYSYANGYANGANAYCTNMKWTKHSGCSSLEAFSDWIRVVVMIDKFSGTANYKLYNEDGSLFAGFTESGIDGELANMSTSKTLNNIGFGVINAARGDVTIDVDYVKISVDKKNGG